MPTKTARILSYLPRTFRALPRPTVLYSVVDAFGSELLNAENTLAQVMQSHWVGTADQGATTIDDLARFAALYGLTPRAAPFPEETVEGFRAHLERYVRTFLDGTVTVLGVLRVTADALGLQLAGGWDQLDTWWTRPNPVLTTVEPDPDDRAALLFGVDAATARGAPATAARVAGRVALTTVDLRDGAVLRVSVDGAAAVDIDCGAHALNRGAVSLADVVSAINTAVGASVAHASGETLTLVSPNVGTGSRLDIGTPAVDAAARLLGLRPLAYHGTDSTRAVLRGTADLSAGVDLSTARFIRLVIDGTQIAEIDCAGATPSATTIQEIVDAIDTALPGRASHDGKFITITSPTVGRGSAVALQAPAAQDATGRLFESAPRLVVGSDPTRAIATGTVVMPATIDLRNGSRLRVGIDGAAPVIIDCAGSDPARTTPGEIVSALTAALGVNRVGFDGQFLSIRSVATGASGVVVFEPIAPAPDAATKLFGVTPRTFAGTAAAAARIVGTVDLAPGSNLWAQPLVQIAVDDHPPVTIDLRAKAAHIGKATLNELVTAINAALRQTVASTNGFVLILTSPTTGAASAVSIVPLDITLARPFVTRAFIGDEAVQLLFGIPQAAAVGGGATRARVVGTPDLSRGIDLSVARFLRVSVDGGAAQDIDCRGTFVRRPRAALAKEIVSAINAVIPGVASTDGTHLMLTSPTVGARSRIGLGTPTGGDAAAVLGLDGGRALGTAATRVNLVGAAVLGPSIDLSVERHIRLGVDGIAPVDIDCAGIDPAHTGPAEVVGAINAALSAPVASFDGTYLRITSQVSGVGSLVRFEAPNAGEWDATSLLFGFAPPRRYHGSPPAPARLVGTTAVTGPIDLSVRSHLSIGVNGQAPVVVDCASATTLAAVVAAINAKLGHPIASAVNNRLVLTTIEAGSGPSITVAPYTLGDATAALLGGVASVTAGTDGTPAVLTGAVPLTNPVDLTLSQTIRIAIDEGRPIDIDVGGADVSATRLAEVVTAINAVVPGLAAATGDDRLRLTSRSRVELLPRRVLELIEYTPAAETAGPFTVDPGGVCSVVNDGATDSVAVITVSAAQGAAGIELVNRAADRRVRVLEPVPPGGQLQLRQDPTAGLRADVLDQTGGARPVAPDHILAGPLGQQAWVPTTGSWTFTTVLVLNNPAQPAVVVLRARTPLQGPLTARVTVAAPGLFDVTVGAETYAAVSIGAGVTAPESLVRQILASSKVVIADEVNKGDVLALTVGTTQWEYLDCYGPRFNRSRFNYARFAGGGCRGRGVFDVSRFARSRPDDAAFAGSAPEPTVDVHVDWTRYELGTMDVRLPADLPEYFGARFNGGRFSAGTPELYHDIVFEPGDDPAFIVTRLGASRFVTANVVPRVPLGFQAVPIPFRRPRTQPVAPGGLFLKDPESGVIVQLTPKMPGATVSVRPAGPAIYEVTVAFDGARFESARAVVRGGAALPASAAAAVTPGPVGVLQAKAIGVRTTVSRQRSPSPTGEAV